MPILNVSPEARPTRALPSASLATLVTSSKPSWAMPSTQTCEPIARMLCRAVGGEGALDRSPVRHQERWAVAGHALLEAALGSPTRRCRLGRTLRSPARADRERRASPEPPPAARSPVPAVGRPNAIRALPCSQRAEKHAVVIGRRLVALQARAQLDEEVAARIEVETAPVDHLGFQQLRLFAATQPSASGRRPPDTFRGQLRLSVKTIMLPFAATTSYTFGS